MANVEFSFGGGKPGMPNLAGLKSRFLTIVAVVVVFIVLMAATTSIPTGHVGVLTLFGRVTGDVLPEGIHLINPLKSVEKMTVQTQSRKESASVPSKEGLTLSLDTSLLFRLDRAMHQPGLFRSRSLASRPSFRAQRWPRILP